MRITIPYRFYNKMIVVEEDLSRVRVTVTIPPLKIRIMDVLRDESVPPHGLDTLEVAKRVMGVKGTQKDVNPTLYQLEKEGIVKRIKLENKERPLWKII
jgi:predicted transcriptional regulator